MQHKIVYTLGMAAIASAGLLFSCDDGEADLLLDDQIETDTETDTELRSGMNPMVIPGNPKCPEGTFQFKIENPTSKTYDIIAGHTVTVKVDGAYLDWKSTLGMDYVLMKGGPNAQQYKYDPEAKYDKGLTPPINPNNDKPYGISHVSFCYDFELDVEKDADTSFKREWTWTIKKELQDSTCAELFMKFGQWFKIGYKVTVDASKKDSKFAVEGNIKIHNLTPFDATIESVIDKMGDIPAEVDCGYEFPFKLAKGATLKCSYAADLPDKNDRTNKVTVKTSGKVKGGSATAAVKFGDPKYEIDECIEVTDDQYGDLGTVCAEDAPKKFLYDLWVHAKECWTTYFKNVASFETNDTKTTGSDKQVVKLEADCDKGCTLTQGYWKTHSKYGPAPKDDGWNKLPDGPDTKLFWFGKTWYEMFWTPPKGDACISLAHQYMAAKLNVLNGADPSAVADTLGKAAEALEKNCKYSKKDELEALATKLDKYNNGHIGPGHCDE